MATIDINDAVNFGEDVWLDELLQVLFNVNLEGSSRSWDLAWNDTKCEDKHWKQVLVQFGQKVVLRKGDLTLGLLVLQFFMYLQTSLAL